MALSQITDLGIDRVRIPSLSGDHAADRALWNLSVILRDIAENPRGNAMGGDECHHPPEGSSA